MTIKPEVLSKVKWRVWYRGLVEVPLFSCKYVKDHRVVATACVKTKADLSLIAQQVEHNKLAIRLSFSFDIEGKFEAFFYFEGWLKFRHRLEY